MLNKNNIQHIILHLSLIDGVGPVIIKRLIEKQADTYKLEELYNFNTSDFVHLFGLTEQRSHKIIEGLRDLNLVEEELHLIDRHNIKWATFLDENYPSLLKHITVPPAVIYWQGNFLNTDTEKTIAFVGARKGNYYGQRVINQLVPNLVKHNWVIVSGGALGIDSMAHRATLQAGGKTVAVLGSGLLSPYPISNIKMFNQIRDLGGIIISALPLRMGALPGNFPARNRIIAGLSRGCVVVQAAIKSGARITARYSLDEGREVFAVPGAIDDPLSAGCHLLIQEGAKLINGVEDILQEFGEMVSNTASKESRVVDTLKGDDSIEHRIIRACYTPSSVDDLVAQIGLSLPELQGKLFDLQLVGSITQDFTGMWVAQQ